MKHPLPALLAVLSLFAVPTLSGARAQSSYVGLHVNGVASSSGITPFGGVRVGGPVADHVELRLAGLTVILANVVQLDVLYTQPLTETLRGYAGGGAACLGLFCSRAALATGTAGHLLFTRLLGLKPT